MIIGGLIFLEGPRARILGWKGAAHPLSAAKKMTGKRAAANDP